MVWNLLICFILILFNISVNIDVKKLNNILSILSVEQPSWLWWNTRMYLVNVSVFVPCSSNAAGRIDVKVELWSGGIQRKNEVNLGNSSYNLNNFAMTLEKWGTHKSLFIREWYCSNVYMPMGIWLNTYMGPLSMQIHVINSWWVGSLNLISNQPESSSTLYHSYESSIFWSEIQKTINIFPCISVMKIWAASLWNIFLVFRFLKLTVTIKMMLHQRELHQTDNKKN